MVELPTSTPPSGTGVEGKVAAYALALEIMGDLLLVQSEAEAIEAIFNFFEIICAPQEMLWLSPGDDQVAPAAFEHRTQETTRRSPSPAELELLSPGRAPHHDTFATGFELAVGELGEPLGRLRLEGLMQPERRDDFVNLALSVERVIAMCVSHARGQARLRRTEERLRITLRSIGDGVIATDLQRRVTLANPVACTLLGRPEAEVLDSRLGDVFRIVHEHTREPVEDPVERVLRDGQTVGMANSTALLSADGREYLLADSAAPILNAAGEMVGTVLIFRDVTETIRLEREAARGAKLASVSLLAGGIAHDFNNMLTMIVANLSLAKEALRPDDAEVRTLLDEAERGAYSSRRLTQQLLTFAQGGDPVVESLSLSEVIEELVPFALRGSGIGATTRLADDLDWVKADRGQLGQALTNLLVNCKQAMPEGGHLVVAAENVSLGPKSGLPLPAGRYVKLSVEDDGPGIPSEVLSRIFDPFFSTKKTGSGLGLATVYSIVQRHGGHIRVHSQVGEGTRFEAYLPAIRPQSSRPDVTPQGGVDLSSAKVLVMDDEDKILKIYHRVLDRCCGEVVTTSDGVAAIAAFEQARQAGAPFHVLLLDLTVPGGVGGLRVLEAARAIDEGIKAIVASGYSDDGALANAKAHGFDAALPKPFTAAMLREQLAEVLGRKP